MEASESLFLWHLGETSPRRCTSHYFLLVILGQMECNFRELNQKLHICTCDTIVMPQLYKSGRCREVICGMRISVNSIDTAIDSQEVVQDEIMVKFREMVGQSLLQVSTSMETRMLRCLTFCSPFHFQLEKMIFLRGKSQDNKGSESSFMFK